MPSYNSSIGYSFGSTGNTTAFNTLSTQRNRLLVVTLTSESDKTPNYVRYGGQDLTLAISHDNTNISGSIVHLYYLLEAGIAAATDTNITMNYTTSTTVAVHVHDYYDVRQEAPFDTDVAQTGNGATSAPITLTMEAPNQLLIYVAMNTVDAAHTWTPAAGFVEVQDTTWPSFNRTTIYGISTNGGNWAASSTCTGSGFITAVAAAWRDLEEAGYPVWFN